MIHDPVLEFTGFEATFVVVTNTWLHLFRMVCCHVVSVFSISFRSNIFQLCLDHEVLPRNS